MPMPSPTIERQIGLVEALISSRRRNLIDFPHPDDDDMLITLRSIAADLRARQPGAAIETRRILGEKVAAIANAPNKNFGFLSGKLIALGQECYGRWRTLEAALEKHGVDLPPDAVDVALDVDYYAAPRRPIE